MIGSYIKDEFIEFFSKRGHAVIPSGSLVPENDPTTLFTTAGMQPLVPYLLGESHPQGKRLVNAQKCLRTGDIEEVGDATHLTFFEMLGNWSLGEYFKEDAIKWAFEFLTSNQEGLGIDPQKLYISVFAGDSDAPKDLESLRLWREQFEALGLTAAEGEPTAGWQAGRIFAYNKVKNWWGPVGATGPCGPDTEIFYDTGRPLHKPNFGAVCHPNCECGRFVEIWNIVFISYERTENGKFEQLAQKNVDTGLGLERLTAILQKANSVYETDLFTPILREIENLAGGGRIDNIKALRIVADHLKAATFLLADGVVPSNLERGYVLRRLIRRAIRYGSVIGIQKSFCAAVAEKVISIFKSSYPELEVNKDIIMRELSAEEERFVKTLAKGTRELEKIVASKKTINGTDAFILYDTYGFPLELTEEFLEQGGGAVTNDIQKEFNKKMEEQRERSRTATEGQFKGGLADHSEISTWYHSATHLTYAALRKVLGEHVHQRGSNITPERLRFDFSNPEKLTDEQKSEVEEYVNGAIAAGLEVSFTELPPDKAFGSGAIGEFGHKYGELVKVYSFTEPATGKVWSKEICGGPHVKNTSDIKGKYRILKEESVAAGIRRIKGVIE